MRLAVLALLLLAAPAQAAEVSVDPGGRFSYRAAAGEANAPVLQAVSVGRVTVRDASAPVVPGAGCVRQDAVTVVCSVVMTQLLVALGDGDDTLTVEPSQAAVYGVEADGGPGDDTLNGTITSDSLDGGGGNDVLRAGEGPDQLVDGDTDATADADIIDGGGFEGDTLSYAQRTQGVGVEVGGQGEDTVSGVEQIAGGAGDDRLSLPAGTAGTLDGAGGDDVLIAPDGALLTGGDGDDTLKGGDGANTLVPGPGVDDLSCGGGRDAVVEPEVTQGRGEVLTASCDEVVFAFDDETFEMRLRLPVRRDGRSGFRATASCGFVRDERGSCRAPVALRGPGEVLLGRGRLRSTPERQRPLIGELTQRGRRLARRERGVRTTLRTTLRGREIAFRFVLRR